VNTDLVAAVIAGLQAAGPWAVRLLALAAALVVVGAGNRAGNAVAIRWHIRAGIRRLEAYTNHPGVRRLHDDIWKEDTP
jgi:hypothetical protein